MKLSGERNMSVWFCVFFFWYSQILIQTFYIHNDCLILTDDSGLYCLNYILSLLINNEFKRVKNIPDAFEDKIVRHLYVIGL